MSDVTCVYTTREHVVQGVLLAFAAAGVGFVIGKVYTERKLTTRFEEILEQEVNQNRADYDRAVKHVTANIIQTQGYAPSDRDEDDEAREDDVSGPDLDSDIPLSPEEIALREYALEHPEAELKILAEDDWDWEHELENRDESRPHVIHEYEYIQGELGYARLQITYYQGDNVLTDDVDGVIPAIDNIVGVQNLERFGDGTDSSDIVFVRNNKISTDFEIARSYGSYSEEVLGMDPRP